MPIVTLTSTTEAIQYDGENAQEVAAAFPDIVALATSVDGERLYYNREEVATVLPRLWYVTDLGVISESEAVDRYGVDSAEQVAEVPNAEVPEETEVPNEPGDEGDVSVSPTVGDDNSVIEPASLDSGINP